VIEAISSCDVAKGVGGSVVDMIVALCEKLTSIEDECRKATEYLTELDALREQYSSLDKQLKCHEYDGRKLATTLAECKANLITAQEKIANLMKKNELLKLMAESTKEKILELQSKHRRQMQCLENENLQLGDDLKCVRKKLAEAKSTSGTFNKDAFSNEATAELRGPSNVSGGLTSTKLVLIDSAHKRVPFQSTGKSIPLSSSRKRCPDSPGSGEDNDKMEKENPLNKKRVILSPFDVISDRVCEEEEENREIHSRTWQKPRGRRGVH
jgi:hypothetical protein